MRTRLVALAGTWLAMLVVPAAAGPVPPGSVPCPAIETGAVGVLAFGAARAVAGWSTLDSSFGARPFPGVASIGLRAWSVPRATAGRFLAALRAVPGVRGVQVDHAVRALRTANDPLLRRQWALSRIHAQRAWNVEIGVSNPVAVAVLDTGVDASHPDLVGRVQPGLDVVDGDTDAQDEQFHGTAVASVVAADADNRIGMAGVSWGAQVVPVRVLDRNGAGTECTVAAGIVWAADHAEILNLSLGARTPCTAAVQAAVQYALAKGTLVVAAAGNQAKQGNPAEEPADCAGVVGVGATDLQDRAASFSEHGPQVAISAPGVHVLAAYRGPKGLETWGAFDGTSMSAPLVSGVAALLLSRHPTWSAAQVEQRLIATAVDRGPRGRDDYFGAGRLDAARALGG